MSFDPGKFNFSRCEDEPIHVPESIQSYGFLFALNPADWTIEIASSNASELFQDCSSANQLIGRSFLDLLSSASERKRLEQSYGRVKQRNLRLPLRLSFDGRELKARTSAYDAVIFVSNGYLVVEMEPAAPFSGSSSSGGALHYGVYGAQIVANFPLMNTVEAVCDEICRIVRELTGFERVIVYRFNDDESGTVIGEDKIDDAESYRDFYYPASDIPRQARELYLQNWIRMNPDVELPSAALVPSVEESGRKPLNLSVSLLRSMSPIHVQYVKNQRQRASMSISLVHQGKLWGLISCHHRDRHYIPQPLRLACEGLAHRFAWQIYAKQEELKRRKQAAMQSAVDTLIDSLSEYRNIVNLFKDNAETILKLMDASGFAFYSGSDAVQIGKTPDHDRLVQIRRLATSPKYPFQSHQLTRLLDSTTGLNGVCGALVIPLLARDDFFTVWFREETRRIIRWAGDPREKDVFADKKQRLSPRTSFAIHEQLVEGECRPWDKETIELAERFNKLFLSYALTEKVEMQSDISLLEERERTKNEFLATLAHELRNPLSTISNALSILHATRDEKSGKYARGVIERQLRQLVVLVDDLLDVSRISRGQIHINKEVLELGSILKLAMETNASLIAEKGHEIVYEEKNEAPLFVRGDFIRLSQIYGNIIHNAAKYTDPGGRIEVRTFAAGSRAVVEVQDNGIGIAPEYLGEVFNMFSQADAASPHTRGGLGIGLTLVRSLVQLHGGEVTVHSEGIGKGSCFTISLPAASPEELKGLAAAPTHPRRQPAVKKRVLVVDDNEELATTLQTLIGLHGHEVFVRYNSAQALQDFSEIEPDIALLDIGLPDMDGYELCRRLRQSHPESPTVYVAQTGWGSPDHTAKSREAGFDYHFVKPVVWETLSELFGKQDEENQDQGH